MNAQKKISFLICAVLFSSCANSPKQKIVQNMMIGALAGYAVGQLKSDNKQAHSYIYAGAGASLAAAGSLYFTDFDESNELKSQNQKLKSELDKIYSPALVHESTGMMSSKVPEKYKSMINPGEWKIYSLDQWIEDSENKLIHQDKMMELIPPSLVPAQLPIKK